jgi:hypothetical protein
MVCSLSDMVLTVVRTTGGQRVYGVPAGEGMVTSTWSILLAAVVLRLSCGIATLPSYPTGVPAVDLSPRSTLGHQMQKGSIYVHVALVLDYNVQ